MSAKSFGAAVRSHWGIENSLHWQLDMSFGEERSRVRKDHADANMGALRPRSLSLLKNEESKKVGIKNKRLIAAWNVDYLRQVLFGA
jgi:predicted transposase YbfD/YdcC